MAACAVYYGLYFCLVLRFLPGEYTEDCRDVDAIMIAVESNVSPNDRDHIQRIITKGCPSNLVWEEPAQKKEIFTKRGNNPSIKAHWDEVVTVFNKEDHKHHLMVFPIWMYRGSPYAHDTPHTVIVKNAKNSRRHFYLLRSGMSWHTKLCHIWKVYKLLCCSDGYSVGRFYANCDYHHTLFVTSPTAGKLMGLSIDLKLCTCDAILSEHQRIDSRQFSWSAATISENGTNSYIHNGPISKSHRLGTQSLMIT